MKRWGVFALGIAASVGLIIGGAQAQGESLIQNGDFAQGMEFWTLDQPCASCWMDVTGDDAAGSQFLAWERTNASGEGSAIWAHQALDVDVSGSSQLLLQAQIKVDAHSLPNSGWWSDEHGGSGEYPAKIVLTFTGTDGQPIEWSFGFLTTHDGSTTLRNFQIVPAGEWTPFGMNVLGPDHWVDGRAQPLPTPARLTSISVGGNGWDFRAAIKGLTLTGSSADQSGGSGGQAAFGLIVEEYPIVSAAEDTPDHFEFKQRLTDQILDVRRAWREPDAATRIAAANAIIGQWGYTLTPLPEGGSATYSISHDGSVLIPDVTHVYPLAVNDSGTDFRLLIDAMSQNGTLVVTPETIGSLDLTHFVYIAPVYVGDDLIEVSADWDNNQFQVLRNGQVVYTYLPGGMFVEPPVHSLWSWQGHWVLEVEGDVIIDGASATTDQGYDEMFGWQFIAGQPFFFFKKTDFLTQTSTIGMSYAGQEIEPYRYQDVIHYRCCEGSMFNISGNGTMIWFYALRDGMWYYVEVGVY